MALNNSGPISLGGSTVGQSIALELGQSATGQISLNDANVRALAQVPSGAIIMPTNFYNKGAGYGGTAIIYTLGGGGAGGIDAQSGAAGQNSFLTYESLTLTAQGGGGGNWNNGINSTGGLAINGSSNAIGGTGGGVSGDRGGGGGGAIGTSDNNTWGQSAGQTGASAIDWTGTLSAALSGTGYSLGFGGAGASSSSSSINNMDGAVGGLGAGGGGAGWYGGNGGPGGIGGGGGGGAAGYSAPNMTGGSGGVGMLLVQSFNGSSYTKAIFFGPTSATYTLPNGTISFQVWLIGGGGGGAGSAGYDGNSGGGGAAGGGVYRGWF